jgi:hypothetical protein
MRDRTSLVLELIGNPKTVGAIIDELAGYGCYCEKHLAMVTKLDVLAVVKAWASSVGGRADVGFEFGADGVVEESIYWLAKPDIQGPVDADLCQHIVALYERRKVKRQAL